MKRHLLCLLFAFSVIGLVFGEGVTPEARALREEVLQQLRQRASSMVLDNGARVIAVQTPNTNRVMVGAIVATGSGDEDAKTYGLAHILEHMALKGTKLLPPGALDNFINKYGVTSNEHNAFTSLDQTYYYFKTDAANWKVLFSAIADLLQNATIDPAALTAELGAVSQEIKMRGLDLPQAWMADFCPSNHPYGHHAIGFKEEVFAYSADEVRAFYKKHYVPSKITIVICGDVKPDEVFAYVGTELASFNAPATEQAAAGGEKPFYAGLFSTSKTIYHPHDYRVYEYFWFGAEQGTMDCAALSYISSALSRRLQKKMVDSAGWCTTAVAYSQAFSYGGQFGVEIRPKEEFASLDYEKMVTKEIEDIACNGLTQQEFATAYYSLLDSLASCLEDPSVFSMALAFSSPKSGDVFATFCKSEELAGCIDQSTIKEVAKKYLRPAIMNKAFMVPLPVGEKVAWETLQERTARHDAALLAARSPSEEAAQWEMGQFPAPVCAQKNPDLGFETFELSNGMQVYWRKDASSPRCVCSLVVKDDVALSLWQGVQKKAFAKATWGDLLLHGTDTYSKEEFDDLCDSLGISIQTTTSVSRDGLECTMLKNNFTEGMRLMSLALLKPALPESILERKKAEALTAIKISQTNLMSRIDEYLTKTLYHAWGWRYTDQQAAEYIQATNMDDIKDCISVLRDPSRVALVIVADAEKSFVRECAEKYFGSLNEAARLQAIVPDVPLLEATASGHVEVDTEESLVQVIRPACTLLSPDAPALALLTDYMNRLLFGVRNRTGLFYGFGAGLKPGNLLLPSRLYFTAQAVPRSIAPICAEIMGLIAGIYANGLAEQELADLKSEYALAHAKFLFDNRGVAARARNSLVRGCAFDFDERFDDKVQEVTLDQMNDVIKRYFDPATWTIVTAGKTIPSFNE